MSLSIQKYSSKFSDYFRGIFNKQDKFEMVCQLVGLSVIGYFSLKTIFGLYKKLRRLLPLDLSRYGKGSWAVVTGASDGIGRALCEELALQGFNIVLIARNKEKLEKVAQELNVLNKDILTKIVIADFENSTKEGFFDEIYSQIESLDI